VHLRDNTNYFPAVEALDWSSLCGEDARLLDLGCGSVWLTALLTREPRVREVVTWDSSPWLLGELLPVTVGLLSGNPERSSPSAGSSCRS
jgi:trans-aconitate methyltransferase